MKATLNEMIKFAETFYNAKTILLKKLSLDENDRFILTPHQSKKQYGTITTVHNVLMSEAHKLTVDTYKKVDCPCYLMVQRNKFTIEFKADGFTISHENLDIEGYAPKLSHKKVIVVSNGRIETALRTSDNSNASMNTIQLTADELEYVFHDVMETISKSNPAVIVAMEEYKKVTSAAAHGLFAQTATQPLAAEEFSTTTEMKFQ